VRTGCAPGAHRSRAGRDVAPSTGSCAGGAPRLRGQGSLLAGTPLSLAVQDGLSAAPAVLVVGLDWLGAAFKGGVLVPDFGPPGALLPLALHGAGALSLHGVWPPGIPAGLSLYLQAWLTDASAPAGLAATNGLSATAP
jgi:hypothetical protein